MEINQEQLLPGSVKLANNEIPDKALDEIQQISSDAAFAQKDAQRAVNPQQEFDRIKQPTANNEKEDGWISVTYKRKPGPRETNKSVMPATTQEQQNKRAAKPQNKPLKSATQPPLRKSHSNTFKRGQHGKVNPTAEAKTVPKEMLTPPPAVKTALRKPQTTFAQEIPENVWEIRKLNAAAAEQKETKERRKQAKKLRRLEENIRKEATHTPARKTETPVSEHPQLALGESDLEVVQQAGSANALTRKQRRTRKKEEQNERKKAQFTGKKKAQNKKSKAKRERNKKHTAGATGGAPVFTNGGPVGGQKALKDREKTWASAGGHTHVSSRGSGKTRKQKSEKGSGSGLGFVQIKGCWSYAKQQSIIKFLGKTTKAKHLGKTSPASRGRPAKAATMPTTLSQLQKDGARLQPNKGLTKPEDTPPASQCKYNSRPAPGISKPFTPRIIDWALPQGEILDQILEITQKVLPEINNQTDPFECDWLLWTLQELDGLLRTGDSSALSESIHILLSPVSGNGYSTNQAPVHLEGWDNIDSGVKMTQHQAHSAPTNIAENLSIGHFETQPHLTAESSEDNAQRHTDITSPPPAGLPEIQTLNQHVSPSADSIGIGVVNGEIGVAKFAGAVNSAAVAEAVNRQVISSADSIGIEVANGEIGVATSAGAAHSATVAETVNKQVTSSAGSIGHGVVIGEIGVNKFTGAINFATAAETVHQHVSSSADSIGIKVANGEMGVSKIIGAVNSAVVTETVNQHVIPGTDSVGIGVVNGEIDATKFTGAANSAAVAETANQQVIPSAGSISSGMVNGEVGVAKFTGAVNSANVAETVNQQVIPNARSIGSGVVNGEVGVAKSTGAVNSATVTETVNQQVTPSADSIDIGVKNGETGVDQRDQARHLRLRMIQHQESSAPTNISEKLLIGHFETQPHLITESSEDNAQRHTDITSPPPAGIPEIQTLADTLNITHFTLLRPLEGQAGQQVRAAGDHLEMIQPSIT